jgi:hypothetical protein
VARSAHFVNCWPQAHCTWNVYIKDGIESGCTTASLQASQLGEPVYARMGFETPIHYVKYGRP